MLSQKVYSKSLDPIQMSHLPILLIFNYYNFRVEISILDNAEKLRLNKTNIILLFGTSHKYGKL